MSQIWQGVNNRQNFNQHRNFGGYVPNAGFGPPPHMSNNMQGSRMPMGQMPGHMMQGRQMPQQMQHGQQMHPGMHPNMRQAHAMRPNHSNQPNSPPGMPPMSLLNPNNDPHVRFEPLPRQGAAEHPAGMPIPSGGMPQAVPAQAHTPVPGDAMGMLANLAQGANNAAKFYAKLAEVEGISEETTDVIGHLTESNKTVVAKIGGLFGGEWSGIEPSIGEIKNPRTALKYAAVQEVELLREALRIYDILEDAGQLKVMNGIIMGIVADVISIIGI